VTSHASTLALAPDRRHQVFSADDKAAINMTHELDRNAAIGVLNRILELELAGVVRYTHYALMVYGYNRIPIVGWLNAQADESLGHARQAGELITSLGGHPSLGIGPLLETHQHDIGDILRESLAHENEALKAYYALLDCARDQDVRLEEYARTLIAAEQTHLDEVNKMLRVPGQTNAYAAGEI
jgi:bacterioferritin